MLEGMNESVRWRIFFFAIGFCAAYAMWGASPSRDVVLMPLETKSVDPATGRPSQTKISDLKFELDSIDMGEVLVGQTMARTLKLSNPTDAPITILEARGSCGCISIKLPNKTVPDRGAVDITVQYLALANAKATDYGVSLDTNEGVNVKAALKVRASALAIFKTDPPVLLFNVQPGDTELKQSVRMTRSDKEAFNIKGFNTRNPRLKVSWERDPAAAVPTQIVTVALDLRQFAVGTETIVLVTDHPRHALYELRMSLSGRTSVGSLSTVVLGQWQEGGKRLVFKAPIQRFTPGELEISGVKDSSGLSVKHTLTRRSPQTIDVMVEAEDPAGFARNRAEGQFEIQTNVMTEALQVNYQFPLPPAAR